MLRKYTNNGFNNSFNNVVLSIWPNLKNQNPTTPSLSHCVPQIHPSWVQEGNYMALCMRVDTVYLHSTLLLLSVFLHFQPSEVYQSFPEYLHSGWLVSYIVSS